MINENKPMKYKALFAVKIGDENWQEQLITEQESKIEAASKWAIENGFHRLRIVDGDDNVPPPSFVASLNWTKP